MGTGAAGGVGVCAFRVGHGVVSMMGMRTVIDLIHRGAMSAVHLGGHGWVCA